MMNQYHQAVLKIDSALEPTNTKICHIKLRKNEDKQILKKIEIQMITDCGSKTDLRYWYTVVTVKTPLVQTPCLKQNLEQNTSFLM